MKILNCETQESTYSSLREIIGIDSEQIQSVFSRLDSEEFYRLNPYYPEPWDVCVFNSVISQSPLSNFEYDYTYWFHLTRTFDGGQNFLRNGIIPLGTQIDYLWDFLYSLIRNMFSQGDWNKFKTQISICSCHSAYLYNMKVKSRQHWGPYAMLVRESAFRSEEMRNHDYLQAPEIIEDICNCFSERYSIDLLQLYIDRTYPCIVKFVEQKSSRNRLEAAIFYLYTIYKGNRLSISGNTCFDGQGVTITKNKIISIELPDLS